MILYLTFQPFHRRKIIIKCFLISILYIGTMWCDVICIEVRAFAACTWKCWFIYGMKPGTLYTTHACDSNTANDTQHEAKFPVDQTNRQQRRDRNRKRVREKDKKSRNNVAKQTEKLLNTFTGTNDKHAEYFMMNAYNNFHYMHLLFPSCHDFIVCCVLFPLFNKHI